MYPNLLRILLVCTIVFAAVSAVTAQVCCEPEEEITLCYLSASDYCFLNKSQCNEYSLDGKFMKNSLAKKLESPKNFGPDGLSKWIIRPKLLDGISTVESIDTAGCDIIFMPAVFVDTITENETHERSFIPQHVFDTIKKWSVICSNNVVIASQGETQKWGYSPVANHQNPNFPEKGTFSSIFDGPFGNVFSFYQEGTFQSVFSSMPAGAVVLAKDARDRPTLAYDAATGDLMTGDIGFFCEKGVGRLTEMDSVYNDNDIFICNLFELACELASSTKFTYQTIELCENESTILPSGEMATEVGSQIDTLTASNGCDSIVRTEVIDCVIVDMPNIFSPNGDGINDYFNLMGAEKVEILEFKIFNRWGQMVYNNETPETGWNGNFKNEPAISDVYVYRIAYRNLLGTRTETRTEDLTLFR